MIDIHSHLIYEVDDGSKSAEMSLNMARQYIKSGFKDVVCTPHYLGEGMSKTADEVIASYRALKKLLEDNGINLNIHLGNEVYISLDLIGDLEKKKYFTINDSKYILIEFPANDIPLYTDDIFYELQLKGYIPIIAHPERNSKIIKQPNILYEFIRKGALAQLNLHSLTGLYGERVYKTANILLRHNLIQLIGTDSHSDRGRSPKATDALRKLETKIGKEEFKKLAEINPRKILNNELLTIDNIIEFNKRSFFNLKASFRNI
jgi:protein-tyrosine phosphatase